MPIAMTMEEGLEVLRGLVAQFSQNEQHYISPDFDETSTRELFINRLFEALGWDVIDQAGLGPAREVVFHPRLIDEAQFAGEEGWDEDLSEEDLAARDPLVQIPDYAVRLDEATRFFVEAKRAGRSIDTRPPAFQVKSYTWSQHVRVGVLTNFRRLRAFDCRVRPVYGEPETGLIDGLDLDYTEYEAAWPKLWGLLSREAVAEGKIEALGRVPRGSKRVGEAFLEELTGWRETLARDLAQRNTDLDHWELAEATQRILDRLIFLRVCEDRTVEQTVVLRKYARRRDAYQALCTEFRRLDQVYNGALFAEHFSERLEVSDGVIQRLIERLYFPFSPYRFDVIGVDLLGAVYERFLGKEIVLDAHRKVSLQDKPEVRHAGGVYYTPRWIVDEIVAGCLDPLLEGRTPRTAENLRIVDPACGSGSFLLGALDYLIRWHEDYYTQHPDEDRERHYRAHDGMTKLTSDAKAAIVTQNLYGVDIDASAVEVAQMSLYLKMLEAETGATLHQHMRLFPGPYLPKLSENIRCGNSLLSHADVPNQLLFDDELRRRINPFDWNDKTRGFGKVYEERGGFDAVIGNPPYTRVQVLRRMRAEEADLYERTFKTAEASYDIATLFVERGLDLLRPARRERNDRGGRLGFIITRTFCETDAAAPLRKLLSDGRHVEEIVDFGSGTVFEDVSAYTLLLRVTAAANQSLSLTRVPSPPSTAALTAARESGSPLTATIPPASLGGAESWPLVLPAEQALLDRLTAEHPSLKEVTGDDIFQGIITGADGIFRCNDEGPHHQDPALRMVRPQANGDEAEPIAIEREALRPVVAGTNDLHRFRWTPSSEWVIFPYERNQRTDPYLGMTATRMAERFPLAYAWLALNKAKLLARAPQAPTNPWSDENWVLYSRRQNLERFSEAKVLVPYMIKELCAVADAGEHYFVNVTTGGYGLGSNASIALEPEYLAGLLNSELLSWALKRYSRAWRGDYYGARKGNLVRLPIAIPSVGERAAIVKAYDECRVAADALDAARSDLDRQSLAGVYASAVATFDALVFAVYSISETERSVIRSG